VVALSARGTAAFEPLVPPPRPIVTWDAPPACPTAQDVEARVVQRLGRAVAMHELRMQGTIVLERDMYVLNLAIVLERDGVIERTQRELSSTSCETLGEAAALVAARSIEERHLTEPDETEPDETEIDETEIDETEIDESSETDVPEPPPEAETSVEAPAERGLPEAATPIPIERLAPSRPRAPEIVGALEGGLAIALLPDPTGVVGGRLHWLWRSWGLQLGGQWVTPQTVSRGVGAVRAQLGTADARGCGLVRGGRWALPLCAGFEVGAVRGDGRDVENARTRHGLWLAGIVSVGSWGWVHPRVGLGLRIDMTAAAVRPRFELRDPGPQHELFTPPVVGVRLLAGVQIRLLDPGLRTTRSIVGVTGPGHSGEDPG
jgi:hypothetical protein